MPVTTFIHGPDKQISVLLDQDTVTIIPNVAWADEATGRYGVYVTDARGKLRTSPENNPVIEERTGNIKVLRVADGLDYQIIKELTKEANP